MIVTETSFESDPEELEEEFEQFYSNAHKTSGGQKKEDIGGYI